MLRRSTASMASRHRLSLTPDRLLRWKGRKGGGQRSHPSRPVCASPRRWWWWWRLRNFAWNTVDASFFFSLSRSNPSLGSRGESRRLSWRTSLIPRCLSRCHVTVSPIGEDRIEDRVFSIRLPLSLGNIARGYPCEPLPTKLDRPDPRFRPGVLPLFNPPRLFSSLFYSLWENIGRKSKGGRSIYIGCEVVRLAAFHPFLSFLSRDGNGGCVESANNSASLSSPMIYTRLEASVTQFF